MEDMTVPSGVQEVQMGVVVSEFPIEKYRVKANSVDLISLLTLNPIVTKTYYHDKIGYRFHENKAAAQVGLRVDIHYNFLVAVWNTDKSGKTIVNDEYSIMLLSVKEPGYKQLVRKYELSGDLRGLILQVNLDGEEKYQKMLFDVDTQKKPPYVLNSDLFNRIKEQVNDFKHYVPRIVAGTLSDEAFMELWRKDGDAIEKESDKQFDNRGMAHNQISQGTSNGNAGRAIEGRREEFNFGSPGTTTAITQGNANNVIKNAPDPAAEKANSADFSGTFFGNVGAQGANNAGAGNQGGQNAGEIKKEDFNFG